MADLSNLLSKNFKVAGVREPITLTLKGVAREEVGNEKELKPVARFLEDPRALVLNTGRYEALADAHDTADVNKWVGAKIVLSVDPSVRYGGKVVGGLTLKVIENAPEQAETED